jgi:hypothetical protein
MTPDTSLHRIGVPFGELFDSVKKWPREQVPKHYYAEGLDTSSVGVDIVF